MRHSERAIRLKLGSMRPFLGPMRLISGSMRLKRGSIRIFNLLNTILKKRLSNLVRDCLNYKRFLSCKERGNRTLFIFFSLKHFKIGANRTGSGLDLFSIRHSERAIRLKLGSMRPFLGSMRLIFASMRLLPGSMRLKRGSIRLLNILNTNSKQ